MYIIVKPGKTAKTQLEKLAAQIAEFGGKIKKREDLGEKDMAYPIASVSKGHYHLFDVEINANRIDELKKEILQKELVLRFLLLNQA